MISKSLAPRTSDGTAKLLGQLYLERALLSRTTYRSCRSLTMGPSGMGPIPVTLIGSIDVDSMKICQARKLRQSLLQFSHPRSHDIVDRPIIRDRSFRMIIPGRRINDHGETPIITIVPRFERSSHPQTAARDIGPDGLLNHVQVQVIVGGPVMDGPHFPRSMVALSFSASFISAFATQ